MKSIAVGFGVCGVCAVSFVAGRASTISGAASRTDTALASVALTQPEPAAQPGSDYSPLGSQPIEITPEMQAMIDANKPGPQHAILARMEGDWKAVMQGTMPGEEPMMSEGRMHVSALFDGKFMGQEYRGELMGMEFDGLGVYGYSTMTSKFQYCWFDSFGTHLYYAEGEAGDDGDSLVFHGQEPNPQGGGMVDFRDDFKWASDDEYTMTRTYKTADGEFEGFRIVFTRE